MARPKAQETKTTTGRRPGRPRNDETPAENLPAVRKSTAVGSAIDFGKDAGAGFEGADRDSYAIPFLTILQSMSPQCKKSDGAYIKGAEEGMLYNTVSNDLFDSEEGTEIIPCAFTRTFVEWNTREAGGGFVAEHDVVAGKSLITSARRDDKGRDILPNKHQLNDTRNHYVLVKDADGNWQPALITMTSTQIRASKNFMSMMQRLAAVHRAPMFGMVFKVTTTPQSNDKGSWYGWQFEFDRIVDDSDAYVSAKAFHEQVKAGAVKTQPRDESAPAGSPADDDGDENF